MDDILSRDAEDFMMKLTGADAAEVKEYIVEFGTNQEFQNSIEEKRRVFGKRRHYSYDYGIGPALGLVLYVICRRHQPDIVVETGVASGVSSSYILGAMEQNKRGQLYSIDLPWWQEERSGWLIPDYLRYRWHLILGSSSEELAPLLKKVNEIDIFLHDSDHSYKNMLWEFQTAWAYMKVGGLLLAHNIDSNKAFADFSRSHGVKGYSLDNMGGIVKAEPIL
jgi:predicted O-methyltransferase YrrM